MQNKDSAYKEAGVDIDEAAALVERIKPHIRETHRKGVMSGIGGFGALFDLKETGYKDPILVSGTDGVGTKIKIAIDTGKHDTIGIDCVAMCVNDVIVQGAEPLFFLDYFATGKLENDVAEAVIKGVAEGCRQAGCGLIGGETAEMPGLYAPGDYDLGGFTVGAVERDRMVTGENITEGDVILGLASSGLHSNGFSLVRKLVESSQGFNYHAPAPFAGSAASALDGMDPQALSDILLTPTKIYVKSILAALKEKDGEDKPAIKGMAHITGGGFTENIPRALPKNVMAEIDGASWPLPSVFKWLLEIGNLNPEDMAGTLNCGIGMIVICHPDHAGKLKEILENHNETVYTLGEIKKRDAAEMQIEILNQKEFLI
ncbi:MAG: phosphoribosylformylglycinamidine cyclo-ligase [Micavibrio sp.]|nr:MAG: phosphoribosylformylglycinamidine cyclo-ligase [Micavibrio sp.]